MCVLIGIDTVRRRDTRMDVTISKIEKLNSIERLTAYWTHHCEVALCCEVSGFECVHNECKMGPHPFRQVWCPIRLVSRCIEEHIKAYGLSIGLNVLQTHFRESFFDSIAEMLSNIAESVREMSKDNPSLEVVEEKTKQFLSALEKIDYSLSEEIAYLSEVSTTHPHVGSIYGEEKDYELTCQQVILAKEKLNKLLNSLSSKQSQLNNRDSRTMSFVSS